MQCRVLSASISPHACPHFIRYGEKDLLFGNRYKPNKSNGSDNRQNKQLLDGLKLNGMKYRHEIKSFAPCFHYGMGSFEDSVQSPSIEQLEYTGYFPPLDAVLEKLNTALFYGKSV